MVLKLLMMVVIVMVVMVVIYSAGVYYVNPGGPLPLLSITKPSLANPPTLNNAHIYFVPVEIKFYRFEFCPVHKQSLVCHPHTVQKEGNLFSFGLGPTETNMSGDVGKPC